MSENPYLDSIYSGQPKTMTDERGTWQSSIYRNRVDGPIALAMHGLAGDKATQSYHGTPALAVCTRG